MEQVHIDQIEAIMRSITCLKDFQCYKHEFEDPCQAVDVGMGSFVQCLKDNPEKCGPGCPFKYSFVDVGGTYCHCRLRVYATKELKK